MVPRVRAAINAGLPPLAVLFDEPKREWTRWDTILIKAYEIYTDMTNGTGIPVYWDRSDRVQFELGTYVSKSRAVLDRAEEKARESKSKNHGKVFYAIPHTVDGGPLPTLEEFLAEQSEKKKISAGNFRVKDNTPFSNADWKPKDAGVLLNPGP